MRWEPGSWELHSLGFWSHCQGYWLQNCQNLKIVRLAPFVWSEIGVREVDHWLWSQGTWTLGLLQLGQPGVTGQASLNLSFPSGKVGCRERDTKGSLSPGLWSLCCISWQGRGSSLFWWPIFILIPKKGNAKECSNYCTIALISHISKVMLKILQARLWQY